MEFLRFPLPEKVDEEKNRGNISIAMKIIDYYLSMDLPNEMKKRLEYEKIRLGLIKKDYGLGEKKALKMAFSRIENLNKEEFYSYMENGLIDYKVIDGKRRYFNRFIENLIFLKPDLKLRTKVGEDRVKSLVDDSIKRISMGEKLRYRVVAGIRVRLLKDSFYRVWLPFPVENDFSNNVKVIKTSHTKYEISEKMEHRTIYMEGTGKRFYVEFSYDISEISGEGDKSYKNLNNNQEKFPHVQFTPYIKYLASEIVGNENDPILKAKKIYNWIISHVRYTYVPEYILFNNISEYTATSLRGDCGMQALLFITLCRASGINAKWQSGWFVTPYSASPHDWAQVYHEEKGWIPVDPSFGNEFKGNTLRGDFYFGSLDGFRMVANEDFQVDLIPEKKFFRSDPVDNQRGEVEDTEGNIYFDKRASKIYVKKFEKIG